MKENIDLDIILGPSPLLTAPMPDFSFEEADPLPYAEAMIKAMYKHRGLGLAANQCALPFRMFVMVGSPEDYVFINPRIVHYSDNLVELEEGCLSWPNLILPVKRPDMVRVRFAVPDGEVVTQQFVGMSARIVQHEMDHLDGLLFYNRANKYHRDKAFRQKAKRDKRMKQNVAI